jgi:hypothetical protein
MRGTVASALAIALLVSGSSWSVAYAQEAPAAPSPPDVVKTKDGSMYRGTIIELVAGDHVRMTLPTGETRNFPMSDVAYAGAAEGAPRPEAPSPRKARPSTREKTDTDEDEDEATVHLTANEKDLQVLIRAGQSETTGTGYTIGHGATFYSGESRHYAVLCTAPCDTSLPPGTHRLAVSLDGGRAIEADEPVRIHAPATNLRATYDSRGGYRAAGILLMIGGGLAGTILMGASIHPSTCDKYNNCTGGTDGGLMLAGVAVTGVSVLFGLGLALMRPIVTIEPVRSSDARSLRLPEMTRKEGGVASTPIDGLALSVRYPF